MTVVKINLKVQSTFLTLSIFSISSDQNAEIRFMLSLAMYSTQACKWHRSFMKSVHKLIRKLCHFSHFFMQCYFVIYSAVDTF